MFVYEEQTTKNFGIDSEGVNNSKSQFNQVARTLGKPPSERFLDRMGRLTLRLATKMAISLDVSSNHAIPEGPKVWAANHPTTLDPIVMLSLVPERLSILTTGGAFEVPIIGSYLKRNGHIPVIQGRGREALEQATNYLKNGHSVGIFPEGALSPMAGGFKRPRSGVARLALASGAPVIPMGIGLNQALLKFMGTFIQGEPALGHFYFRGPYVVTIGNPQFFSGSKEDRSLVRDVSREIMATIIQLSHESARRVPRLPVNVEGQVGGSIAKQSRYAWSHIQTNES